MVIAYGGAPAVVALVSGIIAAEVFLFTLAALGVIFTVAAAYLGASESPDLAIFGMISLVLVFGAGYNGILVPQANTARQQQPIADDFVRSHTSIYNGTVTTAKVYEVQSCALIVGGCSNVINENVTITLSNGAILSKQYTCSYFSIGQNVKVVESPTFSTALTGGNATYYYGYGYFIGYTYSIQDVPVGC